MHDQAVRPHHEARVALELLSRRLERAGRGALLQLLTAHADADPRFRPILQRLAHTASRR